MDTLLTDLFRAYYDARRNKRNTPSQLSFEMDLETNLIRLYWELRDFKYRPAPCVCFVVRESVKREIFASDFRDRIVHHLYYNYLAPLFDRLFVYDSYSCRKGKGTLFGIQRLEHHVRSVSQNYTRGAYLLKMDVQGYFMSIDRSKLCGLVHEMTDKVKLAPSVKRLVDYLTDILTQKDPMLDVRIKGKPEEWEDLPPSKCLSSSPPGVGLPIGDLTSQLFSNVFLGRLDWFVTMELGFKHYGRYVDDFYIVDTDRGRLEAAVEKITEELLTLGLKPHPTKLRIQPVTDPIHYLGAVIHPFYRHCSSRTMQKYLFAKRAFLFLVGNGYDVKRINARRCLSSMNSYCGYLRHFAAGRQLSF